MKVTGLLLLLSGLSVAYKAPHTPRHYRHFDEYLRSLDAEQQALLTGDLQENQEVEGSGEDDEASTKDPMLTFRPRLQLPLRTGFAKSKETTCCMLGQMAGDKGYHCYTKFYAARIILRNQNRAHNRKMAFYGREKVAKYGEKLMRTFEQCVAGRGLVFHKCCHLAAMDRRSAPHYDSFRRRQYIDGKKV